MKVLTKRNLSFSEKKTQEIYRGWCGNINACFQKKYSEKQILIHFHF